VSYLGSQIRVVLHLSKYGKWLSFSCCVEDVISLPNDDTAILQCIDMYVYVVIHHSACIQLNRRATTHCSKSLGMTSRTGEFAALSQGCGQDISGLQAAPWDKSHCQKTE